jgi:ligand-binding sensor domain-containing protein
LTAANVGAEAELDYGDRSGERWRWTDWLAGTYGAGVMRLDAAGVVSAMEGNDGGRRWSIRDAMLSDAAACVCGNTGATGLLAWDDGDGHVGRRVTAGLPSLNVTALAEREGELYVGTDNGLVRIAEISRAGERG